MLQYDPSQRLSAEAALHHYYLRMFHLPEDEPDAPEIFNFDFEKLSPSELERKKSKKNSFKFMLTSNKVL